MGCLLANHMQKVCGWAADFFADAAYEIGLEMRFDIPTVREVRFWVYGLHAWLDAVNADPRWGALSTMGKPDGTVLEFCAWALAQDLERIREELRDRIADGLLLFEQRLVEDYGLGGQLPPAAVWEVFGRFTLCVWYLQELASDLRLCAKTARLLHRQTAAAWHRDRERIAQDRASCGPKPE